VCTETTAVIALMNPTVGRIQSVQIAKKLKVVPQATMKTPNSINNPVEGTGFSLIDKMISVNGME